MGSPADRFTRLQKVAVFLIALGEDRVRPLLTGLGAGTLEQLNAAILGLGDVTPRERAAAMLEVEAYLRHGTPLRPGPGETDPPGRPATTPGRRRAASPPPRPETGWRRGGEPEPGAEGQPWAAPGREPGSGPGGEREPEVPGQPWAAPPSPPATQTPRPDRPRSADTPVRPGLGRRPGMDPAPPAPRGAGASAARGLRPYRPLDSAGAPPKGHERTAGGPPTANPPEANAGDKAANEALRRLRRRLDEGGIDWGRAGFDFGEGFAGPPRDRP